MQFHQSGCTNKPSCGVKPYLVGVWLKPLLIDIVFYISRRGGFLEYSCSPSFRDPVLYKVICAYEIFRCSGASGAVYRVTDQCVGMSVGAVCGTTRSMVTTTG